MSSSVDKREGIGLCRNTTYIIKVGLTEHFNMEVIFNLKDLLMPGDWFTKVDLKDAYFTVPIEANHQQHLLEGMGYQFTCLSR